MSTVGNSETARTISSKVRYHLTAGLGDKVTERFVVDGLLDEPGRAVGHEHVDAAGMKGVVASAPAIGAVDDARTGRARTVKQSAVDPTLAVEEVPPTASAAGGEPGASWRCA